MPYTSKIRKKQRRLTVFAVACIVLLIAVIGAYVAWKHHMTSTAPETNLNHGAANSNASVRGGNNSGQTTSPSSPKGGSDSSSASPPATSVQPDTPTGQFVSNHMPDLSGKPYPNSETSTCSTTPGVLCKIQFTMGTTVKTLPGKYTDSDGNAVWSSWTLQSIGLTTGTWHITALAINGGKTAQANDPIDLQVGP